MKHLIIRNLGPLSNVDIDLGRVNLIIGSQSSGKSCVLRTAAFCAWVEKRIMLCQSPEYFERSTHFMDDFLGYYKMEKYLKDDTFISYETIYAKFSYDNKKTENLRFCYEPKGNSWRYKRPKISYVPSNRNVVSLFPDFKHLPNAGSYLQEFMTEWDKARHHVGEEENVLGIGVSYRFDSSNNAGRDVVTLKDGNEMTLSETSSGLQSMMPVCVHLDFITEGIYKEPDYCLNNLSIDKQEEIKGMLNTIYNRCLSQENRVYKYKSIVKINDKHLSYQFDVETDKKRFDKYVDRLLKTHHTDVFLEEPENNLFPPTQCQMVDWLLKRFTGADRNDMLFVTTHSPYVLEEILKYRGKFFKMFMTVPIKDTNMYNVETFTDEVIEDIRMNGVDVFFNFEAYV